MRMILILMLVAVIAPCACVQVASDSIAVRDLLESVPALQALDPETLVGFAPLPGAERIVSGRELIRIGRRQGLILSDVPDVCVERLLRPVSGDEMRTALVAALGIANAELEIVDFSKQPLPPGRLEFQRSALNQPPASAAESPVTWRGKLIYDGRRSVAVWAKVRITVDHPVFLATEDIPAGAVIREDQVKTANVRQFPLSGPALESAEEIIGKVARRSIPSGQRFVPGALDEAKDVTKGSVIHVRVIDGLATLSFDGIAESSGKRGDTILVHNSASGRNFRAVVEEKGRAVVRPASGD